ncbi:MAG: leucine-rich repeat protein [Ferruginibacter sp.]|nr:leucine-rich repeat protein [Ferruginibacter sp.]
MKKIIFFNCICFFVLFTNAQQIAKVTINSTGVTEKISIGLDEGVLLNISLDGNLIDYGVEYFSEKYAGFSRMEPYIGRTEMYTTFDNKAYQGKLKYIGKYAVTYYASFDAESLQGKIKSIGTLMFNYYLPFEDASLKGKIKTIGTNNITYYSSYENEALKGKLKSVGNTSLTYYTSFDDKAIKGKIKSIGQSSFTYYSSFDRQYAGAMKTGSQRQNVGGINFVVN